MTDWTGAVADALPADAESATLVGRAWDATAGGPVVVAVRNGEVRDLSGSFALMRDVTEAGDPVSAVTAADGPVLGTVTALLANTPADVRDTDRPWLLSPIDLHVVKAAGVTFPVSMLERIIEEKARGEAEAAEAIRAEVLDALGSDLSDLVPGSPEAARLKSLLVGKGLWSQYLEVGIGPDAEIFTKAPVLATVGTGVDVGVRSDSAWNNPEPEVVLVIGSTGRIVGATLGNDVNLRDIEGRSALLLGQAKDNNASASVGPFVRLFDEGFGLDDLRRETVTLRVDGTDGFVLEATSPLAEISRDPADLAAQALGATHQYPDGLVLYLGTMFAPSKDRDVPGSGFTHHVDDIVRIASPALGALVNRVRHTEDVEPWTFGISALIASLAARGLRTGVAP
ncbi:fumarylacetoacetate hydrolase family protein [Planctomonas psychrotolerans]|uniref:fumarylacetoacetate hydrolase family protein n=1 Tax=Planctomonas psychrotolerans TaxID=2528712 RepID=UPI0012389389|nr:fumarylacetoacetate hydrolase family protein [Planctomonas psychrotolerans]